jgi:hypothetical protein
MSDVMSFTEIHDQLVELLPARTVLSLPYVGMTDTGGGEQGSAGSGGSNDGMWSWLLGSKEQTSGSDPKLVIPLPKILPGS